MSSRAGVVILFAFILASATACGSSQGNAISGAGAQGVSATPNFSLALSGGVTRNSSSGTPTCFLGGLSPGSTHPFMDVTLSDSATQTSLTMRIPDIVTGTYAPPSMSGVLSDPGFAPALTSPGNVPTGVLSSGHLGLTSQGVTGTGTTTHLASVSGDFDLMSTFSPPAPCVFCKAPPPVLARAVGHFNCSAALR